MAKILIVDDERAITEPLQYSLTHEGYEVLIAANGHEGLKLAETIPPDLVLLDLKLPGIDGMEVCRRIRVFSAVPIIMLTARGDEADRITGLEMGADDYLSKPFSFRELLARIRANLRRVSLDLNPPDDAPLQIGLFTLDRIAHRAIKNNVEIEFSAREYDLLEQLMMNAGRALSREALMNAVWGINWIGDPRTLDVHIRWLRTKIEDDPADPRYIQTVRGMGYRFAGQEEFE